MKLARDKQLHLLAGIVIAVLVSLALMWSPLHLNPAPACVLGALVAGIVGWLKEKVYDKNRPENHTVDMADFHWTFIGGVLGAVAVAVLVSAGVLPLRW